MNENLDSCTCPSGDGSLRHPCTSHPATLATAKHGGCVQLATRRFIAERTTSPENRQDVLDGDYDGTEWFGHVQAALSAQPTPGGQDADMQALSASIGEVAHRLSTYMPHLSEWADRARDCGKAAEVLSALAASQPVGEPVGEVYQGSSRLPQARLTKPLPVGALLYASPPAQAVDLGQFREPVECWMRGIQSIADNQQEDDGERNAARNLLRRGEWLLALIDSQAVQS